MHWSDLSVKIRNIHVTRWVASYYIGGGTPSIHMARKWLERVIVDGEHLNSEEVECLAHAIVCGKLELQTSIEECKKEIINEIESDYYDELIKYDLHGCCSVE